MTYEARQGQHDDLVLATCLPIWLGSQRFCQMRTRSGDDDPANWVPYREVTALDAECAAIEQEEIEACRKEADWLAEQAELRRRKQNMPSWYVEPMTAHESKKFWSTITWN